MKRPNLQQSSVFSLLLLFLLIGCTGYGKKLEYNGTEVYYTKEIQKEEAVKLGEFLVRSKFADGRTKSVQLTKNTENGHYVFRMVTNEKAQTNETYEILFKALAIQVSDSVFNKHAVDFDVCNNRFETVKSLAFTTSE